MRFYCLFSIYALLEAVIEKCFLNSCLFKLKNPWKYLESIHCYSRCKLQASHFSEINSSTLQKLLPFVLGNG